MLVMDVIKESMERKIVINAEDGTRYEFEKVPHFNYLGVTITERGDEKVEIQERMIKGTKCAAMMKNVLRAKIVSRNIKLKIYKTIIKPVVLYGCELWKLNQKERESLAVWERRILRGIFGGKKEGEQWKRRTNTELQQLYKEAPIINVIRAQRIRWLGHVSRLPDSRIPKQVLVGGISGRRGRGRPRTQWLEMVEKDLLEIGVTDWRRRTRNKKEWKSISKKAMSQLGS